MATVGGKITIQSISFLFYHYFLNTASFISFYRFGRCKLKIILSILISGLLGIVIFQEFLSYRWAARSWLDLQPHETDSKFLRILLVSDCQLIGYQNDLPGIFGSFARYDADRYLAKGYHQAVQHHNPDMVIFLGDLFDEGSIATNDEFEATLDRFFHIFPMSKQALFLYLSGDNDVGGEGRERFSTAAERRFLRYFDTQSRLKFISFKFIKFIQTSVMSGEYRMVGMVSEDTLDTEVLSVMLSHFPLLDRKDFATERMLQNVKPHLVLSAHDHEALIVLRQNILQRSTVSLTPVKSDDRFVFSKTFLTDNNSGRRIKRNATIGMPSYEIVSPTCSYRMGVRHMGYGAMIIEQFHDKSVGVKYSIFWTPDRYGQLYIYLVLLLCFGFSLLSYATLYLCKRFRFYLEVHQRKLRR